MFEFFFRKKITLSQEQLNEKYNDKSELPKMIRLDACTLCQLKCPECYAQKAIAKRNNALGKGYLKFENFKNLIDDNEQLEEIELSNAGEIFLNPELVQIIKYAHEKGVKLTANNGVNLNYLSDEQAEALVKYSFEALTVSIDGASSETYKIYRVGGDYNKVLENLKKIINLKKQYKSIYPFLTWKFVVFGHNEHEIPKVKEIAKEIGVDELIFDGNYEKKYSPIKNVDFVKKETGLKRPEINSDFAVRIKEFREGNANWYECAMLWTPQINWNGDILGCCSNYRKAFDGNVFRDGLLNALNNPHLIYAKNMVMNKAKKKWGIVCSGCWLYKLMKKHNEWIPSQKKKDNL
ncbi:MAG: radical SAM protein [Candidatus Gastranaerophilales bacterium]|nr:radical SAM protein [Candidatus Gastranaerophilales bacterium]